MDDITERFERITGRFTDVVRGVPDGAWDDPSPCEGWTARDVVGHLAEWIPGFFGSQGVEFPPVPSVDDDPAAAWEVVRGTISDALTDPAVAAKPVPSVDDDPAAAWEVVRRTISDALADPSVAAKPVETPFATQPLAETVDMIVTGDVFTHTWDLARATGRDETLDPEQLRRMMAAMAEMPEEAMRTDGMFGPRIEVADDADEQTRFLAYVGRRA